jgi:hypothetical protein
MTGLPTRIIAAGGWAGSTGAAPCPVTMPAYARDRPPSQAWALGDEPVAAASIRVPVACVVGGQIGQLQRRDRPHRCEGKFLPGGCAGPGNGNPPTYPPACHWNLEAGQSINLAPAPGYRQVPG